jgi:AAA ATPase domain
LDTQITNLDLNKFEKLNGELKSLAKINLLIGPNGSGKSSVLRLLFENKWTQSQAITKESASLPERAPLRAFKYRAALIESSNKTTFSIELFKKVAHLFPGTVFNEEQTQVPFRSERPGETIEGTKTTKVPLIDGTPVTDLSSTAPGAWRMLARMRSEIDKAAAVQSSSVNADQSRLTLLCIEEPETGLHPGLQKLLLKDLSLWLDQFKNPVQCFITTHSPFIVGASADLDDCRVYLMKDCQPCDLTGKSGTESAKNGFHGEEALLAAHSLLGSGINDFVPSLTFCENSIYVFLKGIASRGGPSLRSCIQTVTGDSDAIRKASTIGEVLKLLERHVTQTGPSNRIVPGSIAVIIDGPLSESDQRYVAKLCERRKFTVYILGTGAELEANYPEGLVHSFFTSEFGRLPEDKSITRSLEVESSKQCREGTNRNSWVGTMKSQLATYVVNKASESELEALKAIVEKLYSKL